MTQKTFKLIFLSICLTQLIAAQTVLAQAATAQPIADKYSGPQATIEKFLCAPTTSNSGSSANGVGAAWTAASTPGTGTAGTTNTSAGDLYNCINRIYRFAIILASIGAVLFIVIAGYMYMSSEGNGETVEKAKSYVTSSITAIVILLAGYILLRALNPDLIQFRNIQPPSVTPASTTEPTLNVMPGQSGTASAVSADVKTSAANIKNLISQGKISLDSKCDCTGNCPTNTLNSLASGMQAQFDGPVTQCAIGYTSVSSRMLDSLVITADQGNNFSINSITGGHHANSNDPHYKGQAVDVTPIPGDASHQANIINSFQKLGASVVAIECTNVYSPVSSTVLANDSRCIGKTGYHIHAEWP